MTFVFCWNKGCLYLNAPVSLSLFMGRNVFEDPYLFCLPNPWFLMFLYLEVVLVLGVWFGFILKSRAWFELSDTVPHTCGYQKRPRSSEREKLHKWLIKKDISKDLFPSPMLYWNMKQKFWVHQHLYFSVYYFLHLFNFFGDKSLSPVNSLFPTDRWFKELTRPSSKSLSTPDFI